MFNADGELAREIAMEKTDEELAEALSSYQVKRFSWWRLALSVLAVVAFVVMVQAFVSFAKNYSSSLGGDGSLADANYSEFENDAETIRQKKKAVWESNPDNKKYFMQYFISEATLHDKKHLTIKNAVSNS